MSASRFLSGVVVAAIAVTWGVCLVAMVATEGAIDRAIRWRRGRQRGLPGP